MALSVICIGADDKRPDLMAPRTRCPECGRLMVPGIISDQLPSLEPVKPYLVTLLKYAREFIDETPPGETYTAIDFLDYLALNAADTTHVERAGKPQQLGSTRKKVA